MYQQQLRSYMEIWSMPPNSWEPSSSKFECKKSKFQFQNLLTFCCKSVFFKIFYYWWTYLLFSFQKLLFSYFTHNNNIQFPQILQKLKKLSSILSVKCFKNIDFLLLKKIEAFTSFISEVTFFIHFLYIIIIFRSLKFCKS